MPRTMPLVVSHYTTNTPYESEIQNLIKSLKRLKLDYYIHGIPTLGSWRENSNYCALQVKQALEAFPHCDILRVDADAIFQRKPDLFLSEDFDADVAACVYDFSYRENELLGGTLFFRNNEIVRNLVGQWADAACDYRYRERNGDILQEFVEDWVGSFYKLPPAYCKIFDRMDEVTEPVIEHFQASRRFRMMMNRR